MKSLLISDKKFLDVDIWVNTSDYSFESYLINLLSIECDFLIIYAETQMKTGNRSDFAGIDLLKHIRLSPELKDINKNPIMLLHWMSIEFYIDTDIENIFILSPGIYRKRLPVNIINPFGFKGLEKDLFLNEFIFSSKRDENISTHVFRNKYAINEFMQQIVSKDNLISKPLWFKKLFYKEGYFDKPINTKIVKFDGELKILLIDDLADDWAKAIKSIAPNVIIDCVTNYKETEKRIFDINNDSQKMKKELIDCIELITENKNQRDKLTESNKSSKYQRNNLNKKINNDEIVITENQKKLEKIINVFKSFMQTQEELSESLLLYTENITESTFSSHYDDIITFSKLVNEIIQLKTSLNILNRNIEKDRQERIKHDEQIQSNDNLLNELTEKNKNYTDKLSLLIESHRKKEYDIILLDMYLTSNTETSQINETEGYMLLSKLKHSELNIPTILFSATKKNTDALFDNQKFPFLLKNKFIKGITPVSDFVEILKNINVRSRIYKLQNFLDLIIAIPTYQRRIYESYNSPVYENKEMTPQGKKDTETQLRKINGYLKNYIHSNSINDLESIIEPLADIIRVNALQEERSSNDRNKVSLFKEENLRTNKIPSKFSELNKLRNWKKYYSTNSTEIQNKYNEFVDNLDLNVIEKFIKITTNLIVFNQ